MSTAHPTAYGPRLPQRTGVIPHDNGGLAHDDADLPQAGRHRASEPGAAQQVPTPPAHDQVLDEHSNPSRCDCYPGTGSYSPCRPLARPEALILEHQVAQHLQPRPICQGKSSQPVFLGTPAWARSESGRAITDPGHEHTPIGSDVVNHHGRPQVSCSSVSQSHLQRAAARQTQTPCNNGSQPIIRDLENRQSPRNAEVPG